MDNDTSYPDVENNLLEDKDIAPDKSISPQPQYTTCPEQYRHPAQVVAHPQTESRLSRREKDYAAEILMNIYQGKAAGPLLEKYTKILARMRERDEEGFLDMISTSTLTHPDFNFDGAGPENLMKFTAIAAQWNKIKSQKKREEVETTRVGIDVLNKLRKYANREDGSRFGDKRVIEIIDCDEKPMVKAPPVRDDD